MSILSDLTIKELCTPARYRNVDNTQIPNNAFMVSRLDKLNDEEINNVFPGVSRIPVEELRGMISPFFDRSVKVNEKGEKIASYGLSSYGYDVRCSDEFKLFTNLNQAVVDYKAFDEKAFVNIKADTIAIPPNSFVLTRSLEYIRVPRDISVIAIGKSTLARVGINCLVTPLEAGWEGYITLEFANTTNLPVKMYANEGVAQLLFLKGDRACETSYADRGGKYQNQPAEIVLAKV